jgi:hypothetical protein
MCTQIAVFIRKNTSPKTDRNRNSFLDNYVDDLYSEPFNIKKQLFYKEDFGVNDSYNLIDSIQYPHLIMNYSNLSVSEKNDLIMAQIEWLITFIIGRHDNQYSEITLTDEALGECSENNVNPDDVYCNEVKLFKLDEIMVYDSIKRLNFSIDDVKLAIRSDEKYELTKSEKYLIFRVEVS